MEQMLAGRIHGPGDVRVHEEPIPEPLEGESLIKVTAVGLCGSDLHWYQDGGIGDATLKRPLVLGHEIGGVVVGGPLDGVRVAVDPSQPCLKCVDCAEGNRNLCENVTFAGHGTNDGGLRQYMTWPTEFLHPIPDNIDDAGIALLEPLGVALHTWDLGKVALSSNIIVSGCGPIGLGIIKVAKAAGVASIIAFEPIEHRRAAALAAGADAVLDPTDPDFAAQFAVATAGRLIDVAFEAGNDNAAAQAAIDVVKPGGLVVLAGIPDDDWTAFRASTARRKGLTIKITRRMKEVYPRTTELVSSGKVEVNSLVTHTFPLSQVAQAFEAAMSRTGLKVIVAPHA